ncbi:S-layer homology domain-containing protein [Lysinibacillus macroides]|uniref:1,4-beta-xylanase n=1 Tax=Lysinibacillus macroides TaxID=33935 RepID=A0A0N0CV15_9BACI|nr:S-layer homology domain-containing protein [Lysinibacillus macroides]KOY81101.1 1,4-beta-xylanase [Lysinibacillus macroides]QPR68754.1 S-layer homology domain-containing protein [Lysinibacillus macroides]
MQRKLSKILLVALALFVMGATDPFHVSAASLETTGAVKNEYTYEEAVFLSGKPVIFKGTSKELKISEKESKGKLTETYNMKLTGSNGATLTRNIAYESDVVDYAVLGQKTSNGEVKKYTEKITIDGVTYTLVDYQFSQGTVTDNRAASDYYSGNVISRKTYTYETGRGRDAAQHTVTIETDSRHAGYENFWGATETQITESVYSYSDGKTSHVKNRLSTSKSRVLNYEENLGSLGSFEGGYAVISDKDVISEYTYDLASGQKGTLDLDTEYLPKIERLIIPKFRDLNNHYAKDAIEKLYSLGIYEDASNFFSPNTPMKRVDFTVAIGKAVDLRVVIEETKKSKKAPATSVFKDLKRSMKDYGYIESALNKGVIKGVSADYFMPDAAITRAQAATIFVRALGLENRAPEPGYLTKFVDDAQIPNYARDGIYIANELGLMIGDATGRFNPSKPLTRAEASAVLERFLKYLEDDLKQNYRDDILFFN